MAYSKLYIAIQNSPPAVCSVLINLGTQACVPSGWCIGPDHPATHAYVVLEPPEGKAWRLDGEPGGARWGEFAGWPVGPSNPPGQKWPKGSIPTAAWLISDGLDVDAGIAEMRRLIGTEYDWSEIAAATLEAFSVLPLLQRLRFLGRADAFKRAMDCAQIAAHVGAACGEPLKSAFAALPDLYPERVGQMLRSFEGKWTTRVI